MKIVDYVGRFAALRQFAEATFMVIEGLPENDIELDFEGVEFCGRGFTQEFLYHMKKSHKKLTIVNQCDDIQQMFYIVKHPRPKTKLVDYDPDKVIHLKL